MHIHFHDTTVTLTATFGELVTIESTGLKIWATPNSRGEVCHITVNATQSWRDDFVCMLPSEFEYHGIPFGGWETLSEEEFDAVADDEYSITISR